MSLQQATPGPWTHNEGNPTRIIGPDDETVAVLYGGTVGLEKQFENAALMAATPSLYAYITERASTGDGDAQQIVESLEGDGSVSGPWKYDDFNPTPDHRLRVDDHRVGLWQDERRRNPAGERAAHWSGPRHAGLRAFAVGSG